MPSEQFANNAQTALATDLGSGATTLTVTSATGFPVAAAYRIRIGDELLLVSGGAGTTTWTVARAQESTTAAAHLSGAAVTHVLTAGALAKLKAEFFRAVSLRG